MSVERALILAPHADDEAIGCGGTARALAQAGWEVQVLLFAHPSEGERRLVEHSAALACLGATSAGGFGLPERGIRASPELAQQLFQTLRDRAPALLLAPHADEADRDHWETHRLARAALEVLKLCDAGPLPWVLEYEVWTPLRRPDRLVEMTPHAGIKEAAIRCYPSQLTKHDYVAGALGLNAYRAATLGRGTGYCEAFVAPRLSRQRPEEELCLPWA